MLITILLLQLMQKNPKNDHLWTDFGIFLIFGMIGLVECFIYLIILIEIIFGGVI